MKPEDWIVIVPAINNGWAFATFVIIVAISLYVERRHKP